MSKAILVIDMPKSCEKCRFHLNYPKVKHYCYIKQRAFDEDKPDWCPLKEVPKKKTHTLHSIGAWNSGYNACIDEILKGSE